jgi:transketolase
MNIDEKLQKLANTAKEIRRLALQAIYHANSGHPGGSLSLADILTVLYFDLLNHNPQNPNWEKRDHVVISKGHASPGIYAALALAGYFEAEEFIKTFRKINSKFQGHIDRLKVPGIEVSTGSLGQGLSVANGMALGLRLDKSSSRVYAILSDGELQEGQCWEAIMAAAHYKLGNLTALIDRNRIQLDGWTETTMALEPLADKFAAFGWSVQVIDGHNLSEIRDAIQLSWQRQITDKPYMIIANTVKGKGVSFMEEQVKWHGVAPKHEELEMALQELKS